MVSRTRRGFSSENSTSVVETPKPELTVDEDFDFYELTKDIEWPERDYAEVGKALMESYPLPVEEESEFDKFLDYFKF